MGRETVIYSVKWNSCVGNHKKAAAREGIRYSQEMLAMVAVSLSELAAASINDFKNKS